MNVRPLDVRPLPVKPLDWFKTPGCKTLDVRLLGVRPPDVRPPTVRPLALINLKAILPSASCSVSRRLLTVPVLGFFYKKSVDIFFYCIQDQFWPNLPSPCHDKCQYTDLTWLFCLQLQHHWWGGELSYASSSLVKIACVQSLPPLSDKIEDRVSLLDFDWGEEAVHRLLWRINVKKEPRSTASQADFLEHSVNSSSVLFLLLFFTFSFDRLKTSWDLVRPVHLADFCIFISVVCIPSGLFFNASLDVGAKVTVSY